MVAKSTEASARSTVFVSYSHFQKKWVERLAVHLKPLQGEGRVDLFDDTKIQAGADWRNEIKAALKRAKVAILLISADFLASVFIAENELPPLLEKAQAGGATIIPVIVSPSRFTKIERLVTYQAINDPRVPLEGMDYASSEAVLVRVADAVVDALDRGREGQQLPGNVAMLRSDDSVPCAIVVPGASTWLSRRLSRENILASPVIVRASR